jgi:hypothetical protein
MEVTLIVVTLLSIALAIAMGILTWRLLQEERLRSDARVAALEQGLADTMQHAYVTQAAASTAVQRATASVGSASSYSTSSAAITPAPATLSASTSSEGVADNDLFTRDDTDWLAHFPASTVSTAKSPAATSLAAESPIETFIFATSEDEDQADAADTVYANGRPHVPSPTRFATDANGAHAFERPHAAASGTAAANATIAANAVDDVVADTVVNANGGLFGQIDADDDRVGWSRHALAVAAVAAVMIGAVIAFWSIGRLMEPAADRAGTVAARAGAGAGANGAVTTTALELMSLRQEMQDGTLTISGLVRNPRGGVPQERLTAVVFFFDGQGGFLSSTRAPLDYRALAPGEESPFQLSAPAPAGVARYRVSFRRDEGAIVPHVDRRQQVQQSLHNEPDQHSNADRYDAPSYRQPRYGLFSGQPGDGQPSQQQEASRS